MSEHYMDELQARYRITVKKHKSFILHAQPTKYDLRTRKEYHISSYSDTRTSMFLSICQEKVTNHVLQLQHPKMGSLVKHIELLPVGFVKLVIHQNNKLSKIEKGDRLIGGE